MIHLGWEVHEFFWILHLPPPWHSGTLHKWSSHALCYSQTVYTWTWHWATQWSLFVDDKECHNCFSHWMGNFALKSKVAFQDNMVFWCEICIVLPHALIAPITTIQGMLAIVPKMPRKRHKKRTFKWSKCRSACNVLCVVKHLASRKWPHLVRSVILTGLLRIFTNISYVWSFGPHKKFETFLTPAAASLQMRVFWHTRSFGHDASAGIRRQILTQPDG